MQDIVPLKRIAIKKEIRGNGKLLLTSEYFVLDGAKAIALPTRQGQRMCVKESRGSELIWKSYDPHGKVWFEGSFDLMGFDVIRSSDEKTAATLQQLLKAACRLNSDFLSHWKRYTVETFLEFELGWGLGSSSTLIYCLAEWADVSPYELLFLTLGGSGYDIACAKAEGPILYQLGDEEIHIEQVDYQPAFANQLYFVHLGRKQDSQEAIEHYHKYKGTLNGAVNEISDISLKLLEVNSLNSFEQLLTNHEAIIAKALKMPTIRDVYFPDFWGTVKSLGAWGGDFVLATSEKSEDQTRKYFAEKGFSVIFPFREMVLGGQ